MPASLNLPNALSFVATQDAPATVAVAARMASRVVNRMMLKEVDKGNGIEEYPVPGSYPSRLRQQPTVINRATQYLSVFLQCTFSLITRYEILRGLKAKSAQKQLMAFNAFCQNSELSLTFCTFGDLDQAAHSARRPSAGVKATSEGMPRMVDVMGAIVIPVRKRMAELRVRIKTGRRLSGARKVYQ